MKLSRVASATAAALSCLAFSIPAQASAQGYLDCVTIGMTDAIKGWVCESTDPYNTPSYGTLAVFYNGNHAFDTAISNPGVYYPGVPAAGYCGTNAYVGFWISTWVASGTTNVTVKFRDTGGNLHDLFGGGSQNIVFQPGTYGTCQF